MFVKTTVMSELSIKYWNNEGKYQSSLAYEENRVILKFNACEYPIELSRLVGDVFMHGNLLKDFKIQMKDKCLFVDLSGTSIDSIISSGRFYKFQLNRIEMKCKNLMNAAVIINLPPSQITGLTKETKQILIEALEQEIVFGYCDETTTSITCSKDIQTLLVCLISLYYCFPIDILRDIDEKDNKVVLRSQRRSFMSACSRINLYSKTNDVVDFVKSANTTYSKELPKYVRQYIDSYYVSEPQRYNMLFAMASSYAEYILKMGKIGDQKLVEKTIESLNVNGLSTVTDTIKRGKLEREQNQKIEAIDNLAKLRNESEHSLYSDESYEFFNNNPSVNVFMDDIACRIIMKMAGILIE